MKKSLYFRCTELSSNDEYEFIGNFKKSILSEDSDALTVFHFNIER